MLGQPTPRTNAQALRDAVFKRDKGVCALCGVDTVDLHARCWPAMPAPPQIAYVGYTTDEQAITTWANSRGAAQNYINDLDWFHVQLIERARLFIQYPWAKAAGRDQVWWHCDHVIPLSESGANDLSNCRSLCLGCHAGETKALAGRRARRPKK